MAVLSVKENKGLAESSKDFEKRTGRRVFIVILDTAALPDVAENASGVPALGDVWPGESGLFAKKVTNVTASPIDEYSKSFRVTCEYDNSLEFSEDPLSEPSEIEFDFSERGEEYHTDATGKRVVNTAGEPFDKFPERAITEVTGTYSKNESALNITGAMSLMNKVNSASFSFGGVTIGEKVAKVVGFRAQKATSSSGVTYWKKQWVLKFLPQQPIPTVDAEGTVTGTSYISGWYHPVESKGYSSLVNVPGVGTIPFDILQGDGTLNRVSKPWPLKENGEKHENSGDHGYVIQFKPYEEASYGSTFAA